MGSSETEIVSNRACFLVPDSLSISFYFLFLSMGGISAGALIPMVHGTTDLNEWFYQDAKAQSAANTPQDLEVGNDQMMTFSVVETSLGQYVAVVYDSPTSGLGGSVSVKVTDSQDAVGNTQIGLALENDVGEGSIDFPATMTWEFEETTTAGFMMGPITSETMMCFTHSNSTHADFSNGARFMNGDLTVTTIASSGADILGKPICINVPGIL